MSEESPSNFTVYRYRVKPMRGEQFALAVQALGNCRWVYNHALDVDKNAPNGERPTYNELAEKLVEWKGEREWLKLSPSQTLQQALMDFCAARKAHLQDGENFAPPTLKKRDNFSQSLRFPQPRQGDWNAEKGWVNLPKFGQICYFKDKRTPQGKLKQVFLVREGDRWYVCLCCDISASLREKIHQLPEKVSDLQENQVVGIDVGHVNALTTSEGKHYHLPATIAKLDEKIAAQKAVVEHKKKSAKAIQNYRSKGVVADNTWVAPSKSLDRAKRKLRKLQSRRKDILTDARHQLSHLLTKSHAVVVAEDLALRKLMENQKQKKENENDTSASGKTSSAREKTSLPEKFSRSKLNGHNREREKSLHKGWSTLGAGILFNQLEYKSRRRGGVFIKVPPAYTSQTCPHCLNISPQNRKSQAVFECSSCGFTDNADIVASLNVMRLGWETLFTQGFPPPPKPKHKRPRSPKRKKTKQATKQAA